MHRLNLHFSRLKCSQQTNLHNKFHFSSNLTQVPRQFTQPINTKFQIIGRESINHNCYVFKFKFSGPAFPLKMSQHFRISEFFPTHKNPQGQEVAKYYTPITTLNEFQNGKIDALIKVYRPMQPNYKGGRLGNYLEQLKIGDKINVEGPFGKFAYEAPGRISVCSEYSSTTKKVADVKRVFFIAAGTGLTPIYQTLLQIVNNPNDKTEIVLLLCNRKEEDIFLRKQLENMQPRIKLIHMLDTPPAGWKGLTGRVNPDVLNSIFTLSDKETYYVSCGPSAFSAVMKKIFEEYPQSKYFKI